MSAPNLISPTTLSGGTPVGGTGTTNTIPRWTGASTLGDSGLTDNGTEVSFTNRLIRVGNSNAMRIIGGGAGNAYFMDLGTVTFRRGDGANVGGVVQASSMFVGTSFWGTALSDGVAAFSGNVGIGTASPLSLLHVRGSSASAVQAFIHNANGGTGSSADLVFGTWSGAIPTGSVNPGPSAKISAINGSVTNADTSLAFFTYNGTSSTSAERARIDSAGRLQVGASNAAGAAANTALLLRNPAATNSPAELLLQNGYTLPGVNSGLGTFKFQDASGNTYAQIAAQVDAADGANDFPGRLVFSTVPDGSNVVTERARIDSAGNLILNTANTGATIQAAGTSQGLKLPATPGNTDPNTLDCYADGGTANSGGVTWTPTLKFGGNTTGIAYNTQIGRYTRIGNMVFATCYVRLTNKGSATGAATIDGLPTSTNLASLYAAGTIGFIAAITSTGTMQAYITPNSSQITLRQVDIAGTNAAVTDVNFANTSEIIISIAYSVT